MARRARLPLILALAAGLCACGRHAPLTGPAPAEIGPFSATFRARVSGEEGSLRLRGVLAAGRGGRLRVEIAGGGESFILVAGPDEMTAVLSSRGLFMRDTARSALLEEITGVRVTAPAITSLLADGLDALPRGCEGSRRRLRRPDGGAPVPTKITLTCGGGRLLLRLDGLSLLAPERAGPTFAPLAPPPSYRQVDARGLARALGESLGRRGASGRSR